MFSKFFIVALIALLPLIALCQDIEVAKPLNAVEDPLKLNDIVISGNTVGGSINVNGGGDGGSQGGNGGDEGGDEGGSDDEATGSMRFGKSKAKKNKSRANRARKNNRKH
ncbi:hypothetical protein M3Y97_01100200 [Aphelenchoides bicaudatus]|nr:hypothetical protein M3Y97_01100200 [Aphelenchoides bicaudatus]